MVTVEKRRTEEVRVKLAPALASEFSEIAKARGLLPATLAAVALGEYVEKYRQNAQIARMVAVDASKRMSEWSMNEEALGKAIAQALSDPKLVEIFVGATGPEAEKPA